jgi:hypothetical protein
MTDYKRFNPAMIDESRIIPRKHVYMRVETEDGETKYLSGYTRGEEVSTGTYKVYLDELYEEHPAFNGIDLNPFERVGSKIVFHLHKEEIYVER